VDDSNHLREPHEAGLASGSACCAEAWSPPGASAAPSPMTLDRLAAIESELEGAPPAV